MEYIERFVEQDMLKWKNQNNGLALEVIGSRQVGKTTTVMHFAENNYKNVIYVDASSGDNINLLINAGPNSILGNIQQYCVNNSFVYEDTKDTVLIIDEIQENAKLFKNIRTFNRYLGCDLIITGSNLQKTIKLFQPAGDLYKLRMYPLSYEEYLNYFGVYEYYKNNTIETICNEQLDVFEDIYETYLKVGGYPFAFETYLNGGDLKAAFDALINTFQSEFRLRTEDAADYDKIEIMFDAICKVLCNEKKGNSNIVDAVSKLTVQYDSKRISTKECNHIIAWLSASRLINFCDKVNLQNNELYPSERFYFDDVGLFNYLCDINDITKSTASGSLSENFIFKQLSENKFSDKFYHTRPSFAVSNDYELDFLVKSRMDDKTYGIEVKSGKHSGVSIKKMLDKNQIDYAVYAKGKCSYGNVDKIYTLPVFLFNKFVFDKGGLIERKELPRYTKDLFISRLNSKTAEMDVFKEKGF